MATPFYTSSTGLGLLPEIDQLKTPDVWAECYRLRNAISQLQGALDSYTGVVFATASVDISAGMLTNFYDGGGILNAQKANATDSTKPAQAFALGDIKSGQEGPFRQIGNAAFFSGLTPGKKLYLSTTDGVWTVTAPAVAGNLVQEVGVAVSTTTAWFSPARKWAIV